MRLAIENLDDPRQFQVEESETVVNVSHFSVFDRNTGETDDLYLSFSKDDYFHGLRELNEHGLCKISGRHGQLVLRIEPDNTLSISMIGEQKSIDLKGFSFRLEAE